MNHTQYLLDPKNIKLTDKLKLQKLDFLAATKSKQM